MALVKNMWLKVSALKVDDMNKVKNDVLTVNYSFYGKVCGVLAVVVY